ncbi:MAG TPA: BglII/BstYI family type II restriction endonuclease [Opitutaceae bacterium]|nr:BglII/BstYI family type II restriction endonuclease [Opitutaceae bacterium]
MSEFQPFNQLKAAGFDVVTMHHAEAILSHDMPSAIEEIAKVLGSLTIPIEDIVRGGGGEADSTQWLRRQLDQLDWHKHEFIVTKVVDGTPTQSQSHLVDHVKRFGPCTFALEIEWNNKDPFYDRDLENFKRLHSEGAISVGGIVTRGKSMQESLRTAVEEFARARGIEAPDDLEEFYYPTPRQRKIYEKKAEALGSFAKGWADAFVSDKFGESTTHWRKLQERIDRRVGNPCPLVLIGIPASVIRH